MARKSAAAIWTAWPPHMIPAHIGRVCKLPERDAATSLTAEGRPRGPDLAGRVGGRNGRARCRRRCRPERNSAVLLDTGCRRKAVGAFPRASVIVDGTAERLLERGPALAAEDSSPGKAGGATEAATHSSGRPQPVRTRSDMVVADRARGLQSCRRLHRGAKGAAGLTHPSRPQAHVGQPRRVRPPYLLLDEVAAHFDPARRAKRCSMKRWRLAWPGLGHRGG